MSGVQFIHDKEGNPVFAVLPIDSYRRIVSGDSALQAEAVVKPSLLTEEDLMIKLPYAGPVGFLDIRQLVKYLDSKGIRDLAINQRAQKLDKYPEEQKMTLDPIIRRDFLPANSPYRNTMQATAEVVDALVESGFFRRTKKKYPFFARAVNALELVEEKVVTLS
ncbi:hypothetical protein IQ22_02810 [Pseudomonas duriflava]|uniref:Uncharacterized protein n=1 Tax=Pseudomonas duriflava TaxID=459528 RepID=A0A562Q889_9PSED|nr:hypothetical protein [Pseudomonas duriflava]TWI52975.1 hypothetical protein IQ22_02810 [Pseudomonas duriflava]